MAFSNHFSFSNIIAIRMIHRWEFVFKLLGNWIYSILTKLIFRTNNATISSARTELHIYSEWCDRVRTYTFSQMKNSLHKFWLANPKPIEWKKNDQNKRWTQYFCSEVDITRLKVMCATQKQRTTNPFSLSIYISKTQVTKKQQQRERESIHLHLFTHIL